MGTVPLTAVTLDTIRWQVLELYDWATVAFGAVTAPQVVEAVVAVEAGGARATWEEAAASGVVLLHLVLFQAAVGDHLEALLSGVATLQALLPAPLTAQV